MPRISTLDFQRQVDRALCSGDGIYLDPVGTSPFCTAGFQPAVFFPLFDFRISNSCLLQTLRSVAKKTIRKEGYEPEVADLSIRR